jgi:hypothetical protein
MKKIEREILEKAMVAGGCCKGGTPDGSGNGSGLVP